MDAVQDLSARAAAYMIVIQQLCVDHPEFFLQEMGTFSLLKHRVQADALLQEKTHKNDKFKERALELIWINNTRVGEGNNTKGEEVAKMLSHRLTKLLSLVSEWRGLYEAVRNDELLTSRWTEKDFGKDAIEEVKQSDDIENIPLPSPNQWRDYFCSILYKCPEQRTFLAEAMGYMPSQIILAVVEVSPDPVQQQIFQQWKVDDLELAILVNDTKSNVNRLDQSKVELAERYLKNQLKLCGKDNAKNALPFELVFKRELFEIGSNRKVRAEELLLIKHNQPGNDDTTREEQYSGILSDESTDPDPMLTGKKMQLNALAFSGGGIRSATFNLGVLQALAKVQHLSKFDYISTVSGGGYIGSWLVAWIKREGSMLKVCNRLNRDKSGDPMAEEVRPVRWLRMYSNYLTPTTGIMSVDSWTVGMTLLRNMLLNQLIIFLLFMTTLVGGKFVFNLWVQYLTKISDGVVFYMSSGLIIAASVLAGAGMQFYHTKSPANTAGTPGGASKRKNFSLYLLLMGYAMAIIVSAWLSDNLFPDSNELVLKAGYDKFWRSAAIAFVGLLTVALLGRYDKCIPDFSFRKKLFARIEKYFGILLIIIFSAVATIIGAIALVFAWKLVAMLRQSCSFYAEDHSFYNYPSALTFIFGPPLILEVISIAIVMRMALLGIYFPDERREWWGRIGGHVHRIAFIWILVVGAALVGGAVVNDILPDDAGNQLITAAGGWAVIIIGAVKAAFSPKSESDQKPGPLSSVLGFLAKTGPYLFALGLLFFLPVLLNNILENFFSQRQNDIFLLFRITLILAATTMLLAWRIGVNEFSMHHFYKNRLVRAYLGGTRSRVERKESSSPFTGFDSMDDLPLSTLVHKEKYYGPYPILNTALNASKVADLDRQDRKAESFIFSPLYCGFDFSPTRPSANEAKDSFDYGYRPTAYYAYPPKGPHLGSAMSISGAAANPNMGYHSSPPTAFLLTAFNVRLGWWIGNPRKKSWTNADPEFGLPYLISNLIGKSNTSDNYISLSDGGHFDNTGLYEMIRRRISFIVLGDAEQDDKFTCEALANTIRRCWIDFGVEIDIDVSAITDRKDGFSKSSFAIGKIIYPGNKPWFGVLIYLKSSVCKNQAVDIREYALKNPGFPHQTTGDQFFDEAQFESYRKLGYNIAMEAMADPVISSIFSKI